MPIPKRFIHEINAHLIGNIIQVPDYPLILAIMGKPGTGKTWQLRKHLENLGVSIYSVSSADLESDRAGAPAKLLKTQYLEASIKLGKLEPVALVIDDIDTTVGEWEKNTGTVNHQGILAFLMHLADNPCFIEGIGQVNRVPVFVTGNCFELLYEPLCRPERTARFDWEPTLEERISIISTIFNVETDIAKKINDLYPEKPIAFFSEKYARHNRLFLGEKCSNTMLHNILANESIKNTLLNKYIMHCAKADWLSLLSKEE